MMGNEQDYEQDYPVLEVAEDRRPPGIGIFRIVLAATLTIALWALFSAVVDGWNT